MPTPDDTDRPLVVPTKADFHTLMPRFATSITLAVARDAFILDFYYTASISGSAPTDALHLGRFAISPRHAHQLQDLLTRQLAEHAKKHPVASAAAQLSADQAPASKSKSPAAKPAKKALKKATRSARKPKSAR